MSIAALNFAYEQRLPPTVKSVLVALAHRHNAKSGQCNPSIETLAIMTGLKPRAVQYALRELEAARLIAAGGAKKGGRAKTTSWRFISAKDASSAPFAGSKRVHETAPFCGTRKGACGAPDKEESSRREDGASGERRKPASVRSSRNTTARPHGWRGRCSIAARLICFALIGGPEHVAIQAKDGC